jgi:DNA polymerase
MKEDLVKLFNDLKKTIYLYKEINLLPPINSEAKSFLKGESELERDYINNISDLDELKEYINGCVRCKLYKNRKNIVFGEGNPKAELVFVGEAPGREEDIEGRPFVGEAGRLLTKIIKAMGLDRKDVYICNVVKCRPPRNRDPEADEIRACFPFLEAQLRIIAPKVICTLGRIAAQTLLGKDFKITKQRGDWHFYKNIPVMPTFHPAYLLRNPNEKRLVWQDMKKIMEKLGLSTNANKND